MKKISQIIARSAFSIALSGALIAAVPGCGRNNTAGTPGAGEFSGSGFSSESDSSFGESDDAAFEATLTARPTVSQAMTQVLKRCLKTPQPPQAERMMLP